MCVSVFCRCIVPPKVNNEFSMIKYAPILHSIQVTIFYSIAENVTRFVYSKFVQFEE